jgi:hypothetical protein
MAIETIVAPKQRYGNTDNIRVFLGGTIDMGASRDWQKELQIYAYDRFEPEHQNITFYNPRRPEPFDGLQSIENDKFTGQVHWEFDHIDECQVMIIYLVGGSLSPISLLEFGYYLGKLSADKKFWEEQRLLIACEPGFWRKGNIEVLCDRFAIPLADDIEQIAVWLEAQVKDLNKVTFVDAL